MSQSCWEVVCTWSAVQLVRTIYGGRMHPNSLVVLMPSTNTCISVAHIHQCSLDWASQSDLCHSLMDCTVDKELWLLQEGERGKKVVFMMAQVTFCLWGLLFQVLKITQSLFKKNSAWEIGGGICAFDGMDMTVQNSRFTANYASKEGGALSIRVSAVWLCCHIKSAERLS